MAYKTILVHLDASKMLGARLDVAFQVARKFDAHLVGLYALTVLPVPSYAIAEAGLIEAANRKASAEVEQRARAAWDAAVRRAGWEKAEWRGSADDALAAVTLHARYADLVVIGQKEPGEASGVSAQFEHRLPLAAGRPVLLVPYASEKRPVGERVLVAWDAGRESARAVVDALPFLAAAREVKVVTFNAGRAGDRHGEAPGADVGLFLARHGVKVSVARYQSENRDIGNQLLSRAADYGSDLIVMGAYGHSRVAELVLGGATRTLLESMTVPVLMAH